MSSKGFFSWLNPFSKPTTPPAAAPAAATPTAAPAAALPAAQPRAVANADTSRLADGDGALSAGGHDLSLGAEDVLKFVVLGGARTGVTSIIHNYLHRAFLSEYVPTLGHDLYIAPTDTSLRLASMHSASPRGLQLQLWDLSHSCLHSPARQSLLADADGIMLVFSVDSQDSLGDVDRWRAAIQEQFAGDKDPPRIILCANKADLNTAMVSVEDLNAYSVSCGYYAWIAVTTKFGDSSAAAVDAFLPVVAEHAERRRARAAERRRRPGRAAASPNAEPSSSPLLTLPTAIPGAATAIPGTTSAASSAGASPPEDPEAARRLARKVRSQLVSFYRDLEGDLRCVAAFVNDGKRDVLDSLDRQRAMEAARLAAVVKGALDEPTPSLARVLEIQSLLAVRVAKWTRLVTNLTTELSVVSAGLAHGFSPAISEQHSESASVVSWSRHSRPHSETASPRGAASAFSLVQSPVSFASLAALFDAETAPLAPGAADVAEHLPEVAADGGLEASGPLTLPDSKGVDCRGAAGAGAAAAAGAHAAVSGAAAVAAAAAAESEWDCAPCGFALRSRPAIALAL